MNPNDMSESDRRLNVESRILADISGHGGQLLVADNPHMAQLVAELRVTFDELAIEGYLPTIKEARQ